MRIINERILRLCFYVFGLMIFAFGIAMTICTDFGISSWDAVGVGLYSTFGCSIGFWLNIQSIALIIVAGFLQRKRPQISCMITALILNGFVDIFHYTLFTFNVFSLLPSVIVYGLGIIVISVGCGIYLAANFMPYPIDYYMLSLRYRLHISIASAMTLCEVSGCFAAFLVHGPIGIGTICSAMLYGPMIQYFHRHAMCVYQRIRCGIKVCE